MGGYNGSGTYVRYYNWTNDANASINISASRMDTEDSGYATGLSNAICKDGQTTITANIPFNSKKITGLGNGSGATDSITLGQVQNSAPLWLGSSSGTNTVTALATPTLTAYAAGQTFRFLAGGTCTGAVTLNIDSLGAKAVQKTTAALIAGDITLNNICEVVYDGTQFQLQSIIPVTAVAQGGTGIATTTAYSVLCAGTTATGALQSLAALGASGTVLTSNGAAALPSFQAVGGQPLNAGYASGQYYTGMLVVSGGTAQAVIANRLILSPFILGSAGTFTKIGFNVSVLSAGNARIGIYNMANGVPTSLVLDCGTVSTGTTGDKEITISQTLAAGCYAIAIVFSGTPTVLIADQNTGGYFQATTFVFGGSHASAVIETVAIYQSFAYAAMPSPWSGALTYSLTGSDMGPIVWMRL